MSNTLVGRQILIVAPALDAVFTEALPDAILRLTPADALFAGPIAGRQPDLIIVDGDAVDAGRLIAWLEGLDRSAAPLILIGERLPTRLARAVLQLPRGDLLEAPFRPAELNDAAARLLVPAASQPPTASRCWSVMGAVGGCGATMLAAEIAAVLAHRSPDKRVCLVDLNLADGASAAYLGATAGMLLEQVSEPGRIDATVLSAFAFHGADGFDVLAAPRDPNAFRDIGAPVITRVLEVACQVYDWVVVDLPRHRHGWTLDVISGSDELLVISELTVPALVAARAQAAEVEAEAPQGPSPRIVLNRIASRLFAAAPSFAEAERALGRKAEAGIASDWEAAAASANLGGVVRRHRPRSKIVKDVETLVQGVIAKPSRGLAPQARAVG